MAVEIYFDGAIETINLVFFPYSADNRSESKLVNPDPVPPPIE